MSLDVWKTFFELGGVILLFLTFIFGAGVVFTSNRINARQAKELRAFQLKLEGEQQRTAEAQHAAAEAKERAAKVEESVAWRRLTKSQQSEIGSSLKRFSGQRVGIQYNVNDLEAGSFASDIASALHLAEWRVSEPLALLVMREGPVPLGTNPPLERGLIFKSTKDKPSQDVSSALLRELASRGFDSKQSEEFDQRETPTVFVIVEHRPEGAQGEAKLVGARELNMTKK